MNDKISRSSFLLTKKQVFSFIDHLHSLEHQKKLNTKYQIANFEIQGSEIKVYRSGMVVFDEDEDLILMIENYFVQNQFSIPEEIIKVKEIYSLAENHQLGKDENTLSVWLSNEQIEILIKYMHKLEIDISSPPLSKIKYEIKHQENTLTINSNNICITNSQNFFIPSIKKSISEFPVDSGSTLNVGIESVGLFSQIGPVFITIVGLDQIQSTEFQLAGVKHSELGRNLEIKKFKPLIQNKSTFVRTLKISPKEINEDLTTDFVRNQIIRFIDNLKLDADIPSTCFIYVDKKLSYLDSELKEILPEAEIKLTNNSMSSASASIINRLLFDEWIDFMSNKHNLKMIKSNINEILTLKEKKELIKMKYVKNKKTNENNKF